MKNWDVIVIGAGIIGLSVAIECNKRGLRVLVVEKGEPGREASWAAGGMLCDFPLETKPALQELASASARMYPEFVHELQDGSGLKIDLRSVGTLVFESAAGGPVKPADFESAGVGEDFALPQSLSELEPAIRISEAASVSKRPFFVKERCVDPRDLSVAAVAAAKHRGIDFSSGDHVETVEMVSGKAGGVRTNKTEFAAGVVVNCAGAWAGQITPGLFPTRPVKGQMLCVVMPKKELVRHVVRTPNVYLIPRSDGRMLIGATSEEAGFDKQVVPETIQKLRRAALDMVPDLANARFLEAWAGLRPGSPDGLPILGPTMIPGYFVATGHFRDGILLAPATARLMGQVITGETPKFHISAFRSERFLESERQTTLQTQSKTM